MRNIQILAALLILTGCSGDNLKSITDRIPDPADLPLVYKVDVQQGNVVSQDMLTQLKPGMDKTKVRFIMGSPLIVDVFHKDRWDYFYSFSKRGGKRIQRRITIYFKDELLSHVEGDVRAGTGLAEVPRNRDTSIVVPGEHEESMFDKVRNSVGLGDDTTSESGKKVAEESINVPADSSEEDKGLFDSLMEKMGVGDNEDEKEYDSGEIIYKDPTNPDPAK